jgi:sarcosine/dimethylglycine N-methyltransferase
MSSLETHYSASDIEARILAGIRAAGLNPEQRLSPEELGALDHFHTGGLRASRELLEVVQIRAEDCVLDIGAGLAGSARLLASAIGCRVDCIEMSPDYCAGADKRKLYEEISRVLKPGGRYAFQEMAAGKMATSYFPLPWATDPADSFLVSAEEMRSVLGGCGFITELFEDTSDTHLSRTVANATPAVPGQLGLAVFVDNLAQKAANARRSLEEGQVRLVRGVFRVN